jgi:hypothetical protein
MPVPVPVGLSLAKAVLHYWHIPTSMGRKPYRCNISVDVYGIGLPVQCEVDKAMSAKS